MLQQTREAAAAPANVQPMTAVPSPQSWSPCPATAAGLLQTPSPALDLDWHKLQIPTAHGIQLLQINQ